MKKLISGLLCAAILILSFSVVTFAVDAAKPSKFLVLGDSIAAGSGVQDKKDAYAWIIAREKGFDLTNCGAGGDISADLRRKVAQDEAIRQAIREADIIAVSIGGNDLLHAEDGVALLVVEGLLGNYSRIEPVLSAFRENFAAIIGGIRALNPKVMLIVQTLYNPAFSLPSLHKAYGVAIGGINEGILAYHARNPEAFVLADVYTAFEGRYGLVYIDMTHPSAGGHAVIAAVLLGAIDNAQAQLPPANVFLAVLAKGFSPVLWLLDKALVGVVLRVVWAVVGLFM